MSLARGVASCACVLCGVGRPGRGVACGPPGHGALVDMYVSVSRPAQTLAEAEWLSQQAEVEVRRSAGLKAGWCGCGAIRSGSGWWW